jgi:plastocyanin
MKHTIFKVLIAIIMTVTLLATFACKSSSSTTKTTTTTTTPTTAAPTLTITAPTGNAFQIGDVTVSVNVGNFNLVDKLGQANVTGQGHLHYFMDVDAPTAQGVAAITAAGTYAPSAATSYTWHNVPGGSHTFSVELVNNNHTPLNPPVIATQQIIVIPEIGPPALVIATPRDGAQIVGNSVTVTVQASNFNLADKLGQANVSREGHIHYFMDVDAPTTQGIPAVTAAGTYAATAETSYIWQNVLPGTHTFSAELINNNHTPLDTPVVAKITVTVSAPATTTISSTTTTSTTTTTTPPAGSTVSLLAKNMAFDKSSITVTVGATVTVNFDNQDSGIPHNFAVYTDASASTPIFIGTTITGPKTTVYTFTAPSTPGNYFFRCDVHPSIMTGTLVVQ